MAGEDIDSDMESQNENPTTSAASGTQSHKSEDVTPEKNNQIVKEDFDDEPDETLSERLWGLTEMLPESLRSSVNVVFSASCSGAKGMYSFSRSALWIFFSSSVILFAPILFEVERTQLDDLQKNQQKQVLLGPNSAVSSGHGMPMLPPISR